MLSFLGSPVDNSKSKPKDINAIGNEAQELLRKQLAIEQEVNINSLIMFWFLMHCSMYFLD